jgi:hypothetical protein
METVGWHVKEDENTITLAQEYIEVHDEWRGASHIPRINIIEARFFDLAKGDKSGTKAARTKLEL